MSCYELLSASCRPSPPPSNFSRRPPHRASVAPPGVMLSGLAEGRLPPPLSHPHTPHCWILTVFSDLGQSRGQPPFRSLKVLQLNLDTNCDYVRIFGAVIGNLKAETDFWLFLRKWWKSRCAQRIWQSAEILTSRAGKTAGTVWERRCPYKLGGLRLQITWGLHAREAT